MSKGVKRNSNERGGLFTREIFGMGLILFSVLAFLCLVIGNIIYPIGGVVRGFLLGILGYYSFVFLFLCVVLGLRLVSSKPLMSRQSSIRFFFINLFIFSLFGVIQLAVCSPSQATLIERLSSAYASGELTLANSTPAGAGMALLIYPLIKFSTKFGAYLFFSLLLAVCIFYFLKVILGDKMSFKRQPKPVSEKATSGAKPSAMSREELNETFEKSLKSGLDLNSKNGFTKKQNDSQSFEQTTPTEKHSSGLFVVGSNDFETKTKKDYKAKAKTPEKLADLAFGTARTDAAYVVSHGKSYSQSYNDDFESKLKYVTTPQKVDLKNIGQTPMDARNPRAEFDNHTTEASPYGDSSRNIYRMSDASARKENVSSRSEDEFNDYRSDALNRSDSLNENPTIGGVSRNPSSNAFGSIFDRQSVVGEKEIDPKDNLTRVGSFGERSENRAPKATGMDRFARSDIFKKSEEETPLSTSQPQRQNPQIIDGRISDGEIENSNITENTQPSTRVYNPYKTAEEVKSSNVEENDGLDNERISTSFFRNANPVKTDLHTDDGAIDNEQQSRKAPSERVSTPKRKEESPVVAKEEETPNPIDLMPSNYRYRYPPLNLLNDYGKDEEAIAADRIKQRNRADIIIQTLGFRGIDAKVEDIIYGPAVTRFVISIPPGVQAKTIAQTQTDLQVWLEASSEIRLLIPIPGTSKIGIEVPNSSTTTVGLKEILSTKEFKNIKQNSITFALGKDIVGNPILLDIMDMPHLIVAGATGTGKSVCLNSMLVSLLYRYSPEELRLVIVDPKMVEFEFYKNLPHLMFNDILANDGRALAMLEWATIEMDRRYMLFKERGARKIVEYNAKIDPSVNKKLPYIIILIDEFAELMMTAGDKKKVENYVGRLAQKARAAGISLIFATQRPSADIIDGSIKTNFTSRICFKTSSGTDSMVVMGETGAEKLLGKGDVLFKMTSMPNLERAQGAFIGDDEVKAVTDYVREHNKAYYDEKALELINKTNQKTTTDDDGSSYGSSSGGDDDNVVEDVYLRALRLVILTRNVSKTSLQTKLGVGYPKAAKIIDWMEEQGFVSISLDNKQRNINITKEEYERRFGEFVDSYR